METPGALVINDSAGSKTSTTGGAGFFSVNKSGYLCVHPSPNSEHAIELRPPIDDLIKRRIRPPMPLRFMNMLERRIESREISIEGSSRFLELFDKTFQLYLPGK